MGRRAAATTMRSKPSRASPPAPFDDQREAVVSALGAARRGSHPHIDPLRTEALGDGLLRLGLLPRQEAVGRLDDRHRLPSRPKACPSSPPVRRRARRASRQLLEAPDGLVGQRLRRFEGIDRWQHRGRSDRDERGAEGEPAPAGLEAPGRDKPRVTAYDLHALAAQALHRVVGLERPARPVHVLHDPPQIDLRLDRREPHALGATHPTGKARRGDQALARHAARPEAVASGLVAALDEHDAGAHPGRPEGSHEASGGAAEAREVVAWHQRVTRPEASHTGSPGRAHPPRTAPRVPRGA